MSNVAADRTGIFVSTLCAVHCGATLWLAGVAGAGSAFFDEGVELVFVAVATILALVALTAGYLGHGSRRPLVFGALGLLLLASSRFVEFSPEWAEPALSIGGAVALVSAHAANLRARRQAQADCCEPGPLVA
jgi:hypothetical protein